MNKLILKFGDMFQEQDGKWSFARISSAVVLAAWLTWVSVCVCSTKTLPGNMWEVSTVVSTLYGLNKVATAITGAKES
jgi:hypothetical protein